MTSIPKYVKWLAKFFPPARRKILERIYFEIKKGYRAPVTEITKKDMGFKDLVKTKEFVVYFHFPFCKSACKYCTFRKNFDKKLIDQYCESVLHEIEWIGESCSLSDNVFNSVYFGGGTPSLIPKKYLEKITKSMMKYFSNGHIPQISLEGSPENLDVSKENLDFYREIGINRISIGAQSFHDEVLAEMKRNHKSAKTISVIEGLKYVMFGKESI
jgi:oxygen-independent coproporphyrinogen-3 oxidase